MERESMKNSIPSCTSHYDYHYHACEYLLGNIYTVNNKEALNVMCQVSLPGRYARTTERHWAERTKNV